MSQTNSSSRLAPWQAMTMLAVGIAIIFFGLMALKVNARIVLAVDGAIMCLMACAFGISYDSVQKGIKDTIASMLVAMLILLSVGVLIGSWMASGTIPVMVYYGMQVITPALFLPVACILCTLMSTLAGTPWGTLATVGVACMGVGEGLGIPVEAAAGAVCVGAFFGDKISPLSDSPVITATVTDTPLMEGIKHALISTGPAYLISLIFFFVYGLEFSGGSAAESATYVEILRTIEKSFNLNPITLLPVFVDVLLDYVRKFARNSRVMAFCVMCLHTLFFMITGAYYVSYPVVGSMTKDMFPKYGLQRKNLMRMMLDTGTGLAPLVPWSTTGSYTASTLGVANIAFFAFAPMLWLAIILSAVYALTGIGMAKLEEQTVEEEEGNRFNGQLAKE